MGYAKNIGRTGRLGCRTRCPVTAPPTCRRLSPTTAIPEVPPRRMRALTRSASPAGVDNSAGPAQHRDSAPRAAASVKASVVKKSTPVSAAAVAAHIPGADCPLPTCRLRARSGRRGSGGAGRPAATTVAPAPAAAAVTPQPAASVPKPIAFGSLVVGRAGTLLTNHTGGAPASPPCSAYWPGPARNSSASPASPRRRRRSATPRLRAPTSSSTPARNSARRRVRHTAR